MRPATGSGPREDRPKWAELATWLHGDVTSRGRREAGVFFDTVSGRLNAWTLSVFGSERSGELVRLRQTFGDSIFARTREDSVKALAESDYIVLTDVEQKGPYPFFSSVAPLRGEIRAWAELNAAKVKSIAFAQATVDIYRVPTARMVGDADQWMLARGGRLLVDGRDLERFPVVKVWGSTFHAATDPQGRVHQCHGDNGCRRANASGRRAPDVPRRRI